MQHPILRFLGYFDRALLATLKWVCIVLFVAITLIMTLNIVVRFVPVMSMHWFDEIVELLYGALIFYGATAVWVTHSHFSVGDWLSKYLKSVRARLVYRLVVELFSLVFMVIFFKYALELTLSTEELTTAFSMPKKWLYVCMPITGAIMMVYSVKNMVLELAIVLKPEMDNLVRDNLNH